MATNLKKSSEKKESTLLQCRKSLDFMSFNKLVKLMYQPKDPASLGVVRFLFGLLMLVDLAEERGGSDIDLRWGEPKDCHFPLFSFLKPFSYPYMALLYGIMWLGACGIMIGYRFRMSVITFGICYWYLLLLDKSYWNNHSYLYGIVTILLMGSSANNFFSLDSILTDRHKNKHVPYWNYFILKYQFFMMYFLAGLKKTDMEWLEGYSMNNLGSHWVFFPFQIILDQSQIDYFVVHWFGFLLDLTIGFWMLIEITRPVAMIFCAMFHLMNSRLFSIGMFPYVCLATMPLFCSESWPRRIQKKIFGSENLNPKISSGCLYSEKELKMYKKSKVRVNSKATWKHAFVVGLLLTHCALQAFLPYSHFITKGYNNWTKGLYGYSWDMMVHSWDTSLVMIKIVDNNSGKEWFLDPEAWTQNDRWNKHADMCVQYAQCLKNNVIQEIKQSSKNLPKTFKDLENPHITSENISVYIDVWCSLNGRFQQRMYDPNYDLLKANWSPFKQVEWLKPVLSEYNNLRTQMKTITENVYSWSNYSDILFVADFPGLFLENYITNDLSNVTLTVLEGEILYEMKDDDLGQSYGKKLKKNEHAAVEEGRFHKIYTISNTPSCFMYVYINKTRERLGETLPVSSAKNDIVYSPFPVIEDIQFRIESMLRMVAQISNSFLHVFYDVPLVRRSRLALNK